VILGLDPGLYLALVEVLACLIMVTGIYLIYRALGGEDHARQPATQHQRRTSPRVREIEGEAREAFCGAHRQRGQDACRPLPDGQESRTLAPVRWRHRA
jgi:hypothetical protein